MCRGMEGQREVLEFLSVKYSKAEVLHTVKRIGLKVKKSNIYAGDKVILD